MLTEKVLQAGTLYDLVIDVRHIHDKHDVIVEVRFQHTPQYVHSDIVTSCDVHNLVGTNSVERASTLAEYSQNAIQQV